MPTREVNFDGIVGPTHHYAGLAVGNLASQRFKNTVSNPRRAALEGLNKMKMLADLGVPQAVLPPHERPDVEALRHAGYAGTDAEVIAAVARKDPKLLSAFSSASAMWTANAATVSPSADTLDGRLHLTVANLASHRHRSLEAPTTLAIFQKIFADESQFAVHSPVGAQDEGAANHTRLCETYESPGLEVFVYGRGLDEPPGEARRFIPRQLREASQEVARQNQLDPKRALFVRQNPTAIDAGVFHNDVICVGNCNVLFFHEEAFHSDEAARIEEAYAQLAEEKLCMLPVASDELPVATAVETYLFNSQLLTLPDGGMLLVAPAECEKNARTAAVIDRVIAGDNPIASVRYVDVRQSMQNGGGPACLRLRVAMTERQRRAILPRVFLDADLYSELFNWINKYYRDELRAQDLADPSLLREGRDALEELTGILRLGAIYPFQK